MAEPTASQNSRFEARLIGEMLANPVNYPYIQFATPIIKEFEKVNALFQSTSVDPEELKKEIYLHYIILKDRVFTANGNCKPISQIDFGHKFIMEADKYISKSQSDDAKNIVMAIKDRCLMFQKESISEVECRLPKTRNIFKGLSYFKPDRVLSQTAQMPFKELPCAHLRAENSDLIEEQYRKIHFINWVDEEVFENKIPEDTATFWSGVMRYKNSAGNTPFKSISEYVLSCLCLPVSNAVAERAFSCVSFVKTTAQQDEDICIGFHSENKNKLVFQWSLL